MRPTDQPTTPNTDCTHKRVQHTHGTATCYVLDRCRCDACREANRAAEEHRSRLKLYGRYDALVDAEPVRAHLKALSTQGVGWKQAAKIAGVATGTVYPILYGKNLDQPNHPDHRPPRRRVSREVAEKLLAVTPDNLADGAYVDAVGTRRRLQALVAVGWPASRLAHEVGYSTQQALSLVINGHISACAVATARRVAEFYNGHWSTPPNVSSRYQAAAVSRAIKHATAKGWAPPMAWDDDTIDDPTATPAVDVDADRSPSAEILEDLEFLRDTGASPAMAVARLGKGVHGLERLARRHGRPDLAAWLSPEAKAARAS